MPEVSPVPVYSMTSVHYNRYITAASVAGVLLSTYALYVEMAAEARPGYKALCDISEHAQCSRVLTSEYSKAFGLIPKESLLSIPNCIYGIVFYCIVIMLATYDNELIVKLQLFLSVCSVASCIYLGYLLVFVLHDFCIVCVTNYVVNTVITILVYGKLNYLRVKKK